VTGDLDQAAQMHSIAHVLTARGVSLLVQLQQTAGTALAKPSQEIEFGHFTHG
jgi:hypothetical protein